MDEGIKRKIKLWMIFIQEFCCPILSLYSLPLITQNQGTEEQGVGGKMFNRWTVQCEGKVTLITGIQRPMLAIHLHALLTLHPVSLSLSLSLYSISRKWCFLFFSHSCLFPVKSVQYAILVFLVLLERKLQNFSSFPVIHMIKPGFEWKEYSLTVESGRNALWQWRVEVYIEWESECIDDRKRERDEICADSFRVGDRLSEGERDSEGERERERVEKRVESVNGNRIKWIRPTDNHWNERRITSNAVMFLSHEQHEFLVNISSLLFQSRERERERVKVSGRELGNER